MPRRATPIPFHEAALAALIVAGAVSAAFARSSMAAALSLGTVGYGVAVMYALLGAPDLAMTQFAVETLTVVIFVLVFYRLRGFGDLSSRLVNGRDALVAIAAGALVTTLVLFIGASGTTSRLAVFRRRGAATGPRAQRRQRHPGRLPRLRHARRDHGARHGRHRRACAAAHRRGARAHDVVHPADRRPRLLMPLLLLFAVFLLLRGHNQPGGGFVGGLVVALSFVLYSIAFGVDASRRALLVSPSTLLGVGPLVALASGLPARADGSAVHDRAVGRLSVGGTVVAVGTPLVFDVGVFLAVIGVVLTIVFTLAEVSLSEE